MTILTAIAITVGVVAFIITAYRYPFGCRLGFHRYTQAFPATYLHEICTQCGKRNIVAPHYGRRAPIDLQWMETGIRTKMDNPPQGTGRKKNTQ